MKKKSRLVVAGGTGFLGEVICDHLAGQFDEVFVLTRRAHPRRGKIQFLEWDGMHTGPWMHVIDGSDLLINMAGRSVNCRYTEANKKEILESRVNSTMILGAAVIMANNPPAVWINSSTATIYEHTTDKPNDETSTRIGDDFSMRVAKAWEDTFFDIPTPGTRKVAMRTAIVLGRKGGVLPVLRKLALRGIGGRQGSGKQMVSWIHELDFARAIACCYHNEELEGVINVVAPNAITNEVFTKSIRHHAGAWVSFPLAKWMLEAGAVWMQTQSELILKSRWAYPGKLLQAGFQFNYPHIDQALQNIFNEPHYQTGSEPMVVPAL